MIGEWEILTAVSVEKRLQRETGTRPTVALSESDCNIEAVVVWPHKTGFKNITVISGHAMPVGDVENAIVRSALTWH